MDWHTKDTKHHTHYICVHHKERILDSCDEIWILCSSGKNNISRVSSANEWGIVFDTRTYIYLFCLLYELIQSDKNTRKDDMQTSTPKTRITTIFFKILVHRINFTISKCLLNVFVLFPTLISFYIRTKDHLYFQNNNYENGGKFSNFVTRKREIRRMRAYGPRCNDVWVLRVF
jgi:hypothetical protein